MKETVYQLLHMTISENRNIHRVQLFSNNIQTMNSRNDEAAYQFVLSVLRLLAASLLFSLVQLVALLLSAWLHCQLQEYLPCAILLCSRQSNLHDLTVKYDKSFQASRSMAHRRECCKLNQYSSHLHIKIIAWPVIYIFKDATSIYVLTFTR